MEASKLENKLWIGYHIVKCYRDLIMALSAFPRQVYRSQDIEGPKHDLCLHFPGKYIHVPV